MGGIERPTKGRTTRGDDAASSVEFDLRGLLTYRMSILQKKLDRSTSRMLDERFGLDLNGWRVLANLDPSGTVSVRQISARIFIDKSQISRAMGRLIERELAVREADPGDARSPLFRLTTSGRRLRKRVMSHRMAEQRRLLDAIGPEVAEHFVTGLDRLDAFLSADANTDAGRVRS